MGRAWCEGCETWRHVAEPGEGLLVEETGEPVTEACCWLCGTPAMDAPALARAEAERRLLRRLLVLVAIIALYALITWLVVEALS